MEFKKIEISKLIPADYNPRKQLKEGDTEYEKIKKSITKFGFVEPIIVNADMTIIGGHQRYTVLKDLGNTEVDCVVVDVDKTKEKALNVALNKISGEWNFELLSKLLDDLQQENYNIEFTGFDLSEVEKLWDEYLIRAIVIIPKMMNMILSYRKIQYRNRMISGCWENTD